MEGALEYASFSESQEYFGGGSCMSSAFMPSRASLQRRHIEQVGFCQTRGARNETTYHALVECTYARAFWSAMKSSLVQASAGA